MRRISTLEGLRGLLALWVVFLHVLASAGMGADWRGPFKVIADSDNPVREFMILSGFVIFALLDKGGENYGWFIWRRFLRLYPAYIVCLAASWALIPIALGALHALPWTDPVISGRIIVFDDTLQYLPAQVVAHLTLLHAAVPPTLLPSSPLAILGPAWSISLEWQFYLLAPAIFAAVTSSNRLSVPILLAVACAAHFLIAGWDGFLPRHVPYFAVGVISYLLWRSPKRPKILHLLPIAIAPTYLTTHDAALVIWAGVFAAFYQPTDVGAALILRPLNAAPIQFLGRISYSIYLSHALPMYLVMYALSPVADVLGPIKYFLVMLVTVTIAAVALSAFLYRTVELPFIQLGKRWKPAAASV